MAKTNKWKAAVVPQEQAGVPAAPPKTATPNKRKSGIANSVFQTISRGVPLTPAYTHIAHQLPIFLRRSSWQVTMLWLQGECPELYRDYLRVFTGEYEKEFQTKESYPKCADVQSRRKAHVVAEWFKRAASVDWPPQAGNANVG